MEQDSIGIDRLLDELLERKGDLSITPTIAAARLGMA